MSTLKKKKLKKKIFRLVKVYISDNLIDFKRFILLKKQGHFLNASQIFKITKFGDICFLLDSKAII